MLEVMGLVFTCIKNIFVGLSEVNCSQWLVWLLAPLLITFLLPLVIAFLLYLTAVILYIYKLHRDCLRQAYEHDFWDGARKTVAAVWDAHGWIWHGYEVKGMENIPDETPALLVYYHGALPIDLYYFIAKTVMLKNRLIHTVADRFLFKVPGFSIISEALNVIPGTIQICANILKSNNLLAIAPGGVYEAQFGNSYYRLMWKKRLGFAKVALEAKVPIIPVFTQNLREAFRSVSLGRRLWLKIYALTKLPIVPIYGGFPVKLCTHVGEPIPYDGSLTPEQLQQKVAAALEELMEKHQRFPGSIFRALVERVYSVPKHKTA
ncbi:DGAT1/2-independent enzyme synthesizing storage lipids isoform X2 [Bacillus rossius redtenbacheri]|uniref:DGAT1/2-independent enzyme synthesizing storage lipids isoform X2 n=1 Tax=Bacillus rossius redtenbacheri TaxID=93214 RepID=UPI002FDDF65A